MQLVGQVLRHLKQIQVDGLARLDGGLLVSGRTVIEGVPIDRFLPRGLVDYAMTTTPSAAFNALTDLLIGKFIGLSLGRRYRITVEVTGHAGTTGDQFTMFIKDDSNNIYYFMRHSNMTAAILETWNFYAIVDGDNTTKQFKLSGQRTGGTGNMVTDSGATNPTTLLVEDIGSAGI